MKELGITKGEWVVDFDRVPNGIGAIAEDIAIVADDWDIAAVFSDITDDGEESKANALLIADAGNTAQKCGLLPSELLQQRDELRDKYSQLLEYTSEFLKSMRTDNGELKKSIAEMSRDMASEAAAIKNTDG